MLDLNDAGLLRTQNFIDGQWINADDNSTFEVSNPANGGIVAVVANGGAAETTRAVLAADAAMGTWKKRTAKDRAHILRRWFDLIMQHQEDLARIMTAEQGKPLAEARGEVAYGAAYIEWFAEEGRRIYGDVIPSHGADKRLLTLKQPVGVVAAITPWNFPIAMITRKAGPALAAGCAIVIKPAGETPLCALALAELAQRAGLPDGLLNVVAGKNSRAIGEVMTGHPLVRKVTFTGSTGVGKQLMAQCAEGVKKTSMELGGNAPFIVFDDADLDAAVSGAIASKFRNAGQTCVCANRILVQEGVYDAFAEKLAAAADALRIGEGTEEGVTMGPLIDGKALNNVTSLVDDALNQGASALIGGEASPLGRYFYPPTVLTGATTKMRVFREEIFGPIAPLFKFSSDEEAIAMANDTEFGLAAYMYTQNIARLWRVSEALEYGIVGINEGIISTEVAPFGGVKASGNGREGSKYGIEDYVEIKYLCIGGLE